VLPRREFVAVRAIREIIVAVRPALPKSSVVRGVVFGAVLLALTSGCAVSVAGTAVPTGAGTGTEVGAPGGAATLTAQQSLGDLATVDLCGIADPTKLPAALDARLESYQPDGAQTMDICSLSLTSGGSQLDIDVGPLDRADTTRLDLATLADGLGVATEPGSSTECDGYVVFADQVTLDLAVYGEDDTASADLCPVVGQMSRALADRISSGPVRHWQPGPRSLTKVDACSVVTTAEADALKLVVSPVSDLSQSVHSCGWDGGTIDVDVDFELGHPPSADATGSVQEQVSGRSTVEYPGDPSTPLCTVETGGAALAGAEAGQVEIAAVTAFPDDSDSTADPQQTCALANAVAKLAWPKLPQA
jgi:hypothetical protein